MRKFAAVLLALAATGVTACDQADDTARRYLEIDVVVRQVTPALDFVARVEAINSVDLIARVVGFLVERHFEEGAIVEEGDLQIKIQRAPYRKR